MRFIKEIPERTIPRMLAGLATLRHFFDALVTRHSHGPDRSRSTCGAGSLRRRCRISSADADHSSKRGALLGYAAPRRGFRVRLRPTELSLRAADRHAGTAWEALDADDRARGSPGPGTACGSGAFAEKGGKQRESPVPFPASGRSGSPPNTSKAAHRPRPQKTRPLVKATDKGGLGLNGATHDCARSAADAQASAQGCSALPDIMHRSQFP